LPNVGTLTQESVDTILLMRVTDFIGQFDIKISKQFTKSTEFYISNI